MQLANISLEIDAPTAAIWAVLADFARPQRIAPTIDYCTALGSGVGAIRVVETSRGLTIRERLLECDEEAGRFRYEILAGGNMPFAHVTSYECTVTVTPRPNGATEIGWSSIGGVDGPVEPISEYLTALYRRATECIRVEVAGQQSHSA